MDHGQPPQNLSRFLDFQVNPSESEELLLTRMEAVIALFESRPQIWNNSSVEQKMNFGQLLAKIIFLLLIMDQMSEQMTADRRLSLIGRLLDILVQLVIRI